jgi:uncharacterized damage-inducible protein DinB
MDVLKLLEYVHGLRNRYLEKLETLPFEEIIKERGASFDSIRNVFLHTLDAEDRMVNYVILGRTKDWTMRNPEEFRDIDSIRKLAKEIRSKTQKYVSKITPTELDRKVELSLGGRPPIQVRTEDILIHVALENIHHFGELIALLWQIDVEPPHMGWIGYIQEAK